VMSDNGSCYVSRDHARACHDLGLRHLRRNRSRSRRIFLIVRAAVRTELHPDR